MTRRGAALTALVSLPLPGLGHVLAGARGPGLAIGAVALAWQMLFAVMQGVDAVTRLLLFAAAFWMVIAMAASLAVAGDAWRVARAAGTLRARCPMSVFWPAVAVVALNLGLLAVPAPVVAWRGFYAPSASMLPTLEPGDRFIVQAGWYDSHPVRRGDVVVFILAPGSAAYVKRVVAVAGDRVRMAHGTLMLNGTAVPAGPKQGARHELHLPDGAQYVVLQHSDEGAANTTAEFHVPAGHVFVMGDNMDNSYDSRLNPQMRYVPVSGLVGRAAIIYWPFAGDRFARVIQ